MIADDYYILGRQDSSEFYRGGKRENMDMLVKPLDKSKYIVVLDHQPNDYKNQAAEKLIWCFLVTRTADSFGL